MAQQLLAAIHNGVSFKKDIYEIANAMLHSTSTSKSSLLRELLPTIESAKDIGKFKCVLPLAFMNKTPKTCSMIFNSLDAETLMLVSRRLGQEKHYIFVISKPFLFLRCGKFAQDHDASSGNLGFAK